MSEHVLVIVESPAKAKKIAGYLSDSLDGKTFDVLASVGHVRDLISKASEMPEKYRKMPWAKLAVNVDENFEAFYKVHENKKITIKELKEALKDADELYLATDEDREGEAIAWHLLEVLRPKVPVERMVFNEITPEAIKSAVENTRSVDMRLVNAQETRRIIDRLYGYPVSEVLWKKIGRNARSAGRVQSVAVRLVVDRERERIAHKSAEYWDIKGAFDPGNFSAKLSSLDGKKIANGGDFNDQGELKSTDVMRLDESTVRALTTALEGKQFTVRSVVEKPGTRSPKAPFMTSTLQQAASGVFRWGAARTMRVAQSLYENGYITYMRTDSTNLSEQAITAARRQATEMFGADHVPDSPRIWPSKSKNAQEAHEAIRPAGDSFATPQQLSGVLSGDEAMLYDLIWRRTVASQMSNARVATTTVKLGAVTEDRTDAEFTVSGTVILFPGYLACLKDAKAVKDDDDDDEEGTLPALREGDAVTATSLTPAGHATKPPARYTEASLVAALEEKGIGRPSTYAAIMSTIVDRGYVWKDGSALVPSFTAFSVVRLLEEHFAELIDYDFTAQLEEQLDQIANGELEREAELKTFWFGGDAPSGHFRGVKELTDDLGAIDARENATFPIDGTDAVLRVGRYGAYIERGEDQRANVPADMKPDELTAEVAEHLLSLPQGDHELGTDPETGLQIVAKTGRYGPYVTEVLPEDAPKSEKPRTASLLSSMAVDTVTLEEALKLLNLPRIVGVDPATNEEITAQNGRYGPYLTKGKDSRTLPSEDAIFTITLEEALQIYSQPKTRRGQVVKPPLRDLGPDPSTGLTMVIKEGRFGPYITDGVTNASLRAVDAPETISVERASDLLAERRAAGPAPKKTAKRTTKRTTAKRTAKKSAAKKSTAKRAAAKKSA